jgi:hypothetical protein
MEDKSKRGKFNVHSRIGSLARADGQFQASLNWQSISIERSTDLSPHETISMQIFPNTSAQYDSI